MVFELVWWPKVLHCGSVVVLGVDLVFGLAKHVSKKKKESVNGLEKE